MQVFVSRKQGKVFVRQDFKPIFEAPVTITEPERPLGTHVFTAMQIQEDGAAMQWTAVTIPSGYGRTRDRDGKRDTKLVTAPTAAAALDRIEMPEAAIDRIAGSLAVGSALIVSDNALSDETGTRDRFHRAHEIAPAEFFLSDELKRPMSAIGAKRTSVQFDFVNYKAKLSAADIP